MSPGTAVGDTLVGVLLVAAAVVTLPIAGVAIVAYLRRRETSYLLVALAIVALVVRTAVAAGSIYGVVPDTLHHAAEHGLDVTIAALVVAAVVAARSIENPAAGERE